MRYLLLGLCLAVVINSCTAPGKTRRPADAPERSDWGKSQPNIRVLLDDSRGKIVISSNGGFTVETAQGMKLLQSPGRGNLTITARYPSVELAVEPGGGVATASGEVRVVPVSKNALWVGKIPYAGVMSLSAKSSGTLMLRNILPLETYLEGVLPYEIGNPGPDGFDALKSQAVAARTYALGKIDKNSGKEFDVYSSVLDQVYKGKESENKHASSAVSDTRGQVLDYNGETVTAYYCACCGGHTSDIREVWPKRQAADYLHGVLDQDGRWRQAFCRENKYFRWRYSYTGSELGRILRETIPRELKFKAEDVGALQDIKINDRTASGRVRSITIETTRGDFVVFGDQIRWVLVADLKKRRILPSVMFRLEKVFEKDQVAFVSIVGGGNGHGVGMCQNGAIAMSKKGYTYKMILEHYYPGCRVVKAY
ncbi:MAG: SpoIID/LytB domain-containing protein [Candidatus Latescibacterota bacterium]|nr:MAG: SpoIID/LytB domain-containing protein [Candidatus Latescibacterota bacterium]